MISRKNRNLTQEQLREVPVNKSCATNLENKLRLEMAEERFQERAFRIENGRDILEHIKNTDSAVAERWGTF